MLEVTSYHFSPQNCCSIVVLHVSAISCLLNDSMKKYSSNPKYRATMRR